MWAEGAPSGLLCPVHTQCDFQLRAIANAIEQTKQHIPQKFPAGQKLWPSRLNIQRQGQSLVVQAAASTRQPDTRSLVLTPLFSGSYTQPEVAVKTMDCAQGASGCPSPPLYTDPSPCLCPPVPMLHFAQFSRLPESLRIGPKSGGKRIALLASDILNPAAVEAQSLTHVHPLTEIISQQPDCNIIVIDLQNFLQTGSSSSGWQKIRRRARLRQTLRCLPGDVHVIRLSGDEVTALATVLRQADIVYAHSAGLTIDALNSGCKVIVGNHPFVIQGPGVEHLYTARQALADEQMKYLQAHRIIHSVNDLYSLVHKWLEPVGWEAGYEQSMMRPIISLNTHPAHRRRSTLAAGKAKLRKLHRSPRQFLQDSRYRVLRKLGTQ